MAEDEKPHQPQESQGKPTEPVLTEQPIREVKPDAPRTDTPKPIAPSAKETEKPKAQVPAASGSGWMAAILIRGLVGLDYDMKKTLELLRLHQKHVCAIHKDTPSIRGMLTRTKDFITFGELDEKTLKEMVTKRGEEYKGKEKDKSGKISYSRFISLDGKKIKTFFRLHPPRGGFERKGIKKPYTRGGVLGNRKAGINDLIRKML